MKRRVNKFKEQEKQARKIHFLGEEQKNIAGRRGGALKQLININIYKTKKCSKHERNSSKFVKNTCILNQVIKTVYRSYLCEEMLGCIKATQLI